MSSHDQESLVQYVPTERELILRNIAIATVYTGLVSLIGLQSNPLEHSAPYDAYIIAIQGLCFVCNAANLVLIATKSRMYGLLTAVMVALSVAVSWATVTYSGFNGSIVLLNVLGLLGGVLCLIEASRNLLRGFVYGVVLMVCFCTAVRVA